MWYSPHMVASMTHSKFFHIYMSWKSPLRGNLLSATHTCTLQLCRLMFWNWEQSPILRSGYDCKQTKIKEFYCCSSSYCHCSVQITEISTFAPLCLLFGNRHGYYTPNHNLHLFMTNNHWILNSEVWYPSTRTLVIVHKPFCL